MYRAQGLKQDVIEERKTIAGYSALVFAHPQTDAKAGTVQPPLNPLTDEQVLETYHKLVRIEDCFRVMKSTFSIRPVHVRLRERIIAHCTLCVLSLMLMRSLQENWRLPASACHPNASALLWLRLWLFRCRPKTDPFRLF